MTTNHASASHAEPLAITIRALGQQPYESVWRQMQEFTERRNADTADELWLVEHPPVYTQGLNGKPEHLLAPGAIPVLQVDRGGQVTYHGPGQAVLYFLLDLRRRKLGIRTLVEQLEQAVIALLGEYDIHAQGRRDAPGVYVNNCKVAALGLRVRRGCCYHGLSVNVDMDLSPFQQINPCGYPGLQVTQLRTLGIPLDVAQTQQALAPHLLRILGYTTDSEA